MLNINIGPDKGNDSKRLTLPGVSLLSKVRIAKAGTSKTLIQMKNCHCKSRVARFEFRKLPIKKMPALRNRRNPITNIGIAEE